MKASFGMLIATAFHLASGQAPGQNCSDPTVTCITTVVLTSTTTECPESSAVTGSTSIGMLIISQQTLLTDPVSGISGTISTIFTAESSIANPVGQSTSSAFNSPSGLSTAKTALSRKASSQSSSIKVLATSIIASDGGGASLGASLTSSTGGSHVGISVQSTNVAGSVLASSEIAPGRSSSKAMAGSSMAALTTSTSDIAADLPSSTSSSSDHGLSAVSGSVSETSTANLVPSTASSLISGTERTTTAYSTLATASSSNQDSSGEAATLRSTGTSQVKTLEASGTTTSRQSVPADSSIMGSALGQSENSDTTTIAALTKASNTVADPLATTSPLYSTRSSSLGGGSGIVIANSGTDSNVATSTATENGYVMHSFH